ncbi:MAG: LysR family transcriptional regulator [Lachnospiraceae bacterium]|nr:LysR family transcriptional regulator [Lachnospiraceae bacterium]
MNITQIKYVLETSGASSMREAASRLFISQPALSLSIRELEDELGILIFDRTNKGISLTDEGREFVTYAKKVIGLYTILEDRYLTNNVDKERFSVSTQHFNFAIKAFTNVVKSINPDKYLFSIHETKTKEVLEDVRTMKSEVGIVSFSGANESLFKKLLKEYFLDFTPLMRRETYAYVWKDHEFAGRSEISLEELKDYPCVTFNQSEEGNYYLTEEALADYEYNKMIKSDDRATTMEIIADLGGYAIGTGLLSWKDATLQGLVSIKLKEEDPLVIGYITRQGSNMSKYGKAYLEELSKIKEI